MVNLQKYGIKDRGTEFTNTGLQNEKQVPNDPVVDTENGFKIMQGKRNHWKIDNTDSNAENHSQVKSKKRSRKKNRPEKKMTLMLI